MSKKAFVIIAILSVVVTYGVAIWDALRKNRLFAGNAGLPFRFSSSSLFGSESTNLFMLFIDIIFWFFVLFVTWKLILKFFKR